MRKILVVDDERSIRNPLKEVLNVEGYNVDVASNGVEAFELIVGKRYDLIITDLSMEQMDGIELFRKVNSASMSVPFIVVSGYASVPTAVTLTKEGVFDVIEKPIDISALIDKVREVFAKPLESVSSKIKHNKSQNKCSNYVVDMIGESAKMVHIKELISSVAKTAAKVLIIGENGTGKELVARSIHAESLRAHIPMIEVNCAAIPSELIESEMFGHEKGAFTGAVSAKKGKFELANGGTLFLDEIGDMSLSAQAKVLRALQEGRITSVGGSKSIEVDVRVIAATNKDLREEIKKGNFREDLFHRLNAVVLKVPPLRERGGDIRLLASYFMKNSPLCKEISPRLFTEEAFVALESHSWSGNIRELQHTIEKAVILCDGELIESRDLLLKPTTEKREESNEVITLELLERQTIEASIHRNDSNMSAVAKELGITRQTLYNKIKKFNL